MNNQSPPTDPSPTKAKKPPTKLVRARKDSQDRRPVPDPPQSERKVEQTVRPANNTTSRVQDDPRPGAQTQNYDPSPVIPNVSVHASHARTRKPDNQVADTLDSSGYRPRDADVPAEREYHSSYDTPADHEAAYRPSGAQSNAPSVKTTSHSLTSSRYRNEAPKPHHLPKRLVMPTPLQLAQQAPIPAAGPHASTRPDRHSIRSKPRAQEIPMQPESRKLVRKRAAPPNQDISDRILSMAPAAPALGGIDTQAAHLQNNDHSDMLAKRLLSKRRTDG